MLPFPRISPRVKASLEGLADWEAHGAHVFLRPRLRVLSRMDGCIRAESERGEYAEKLMQPARLPARLMLMFFPCFERWAKVLIRWRFA